MALFEEQSKFYATSLSFLPVSIQSLRQAFEHDHDPDQMI